MKTLKEVMKDTGIDTSRIKVLTRGRGRNASTFLMVTGVTDEEIKTVRENENILPNQLLPISAFGGSDAMLSVRKAGEKFLQDSIERTVARNGIVALESTLEAASQEDLV